MSTTQTQHTAGQKKHLSCITCEQALPLDREGDPIEPSYFAQSSIHFTEENGGHRFCETIARLVRHMGTITDALWDQLQQSFMDRREHLAAARSLCGVLEDISDEANRRIGQLNTWLLTHITEEAEERKAAEHKTETPPPSTPTPEVPTVLRAHAFELVDTEGKVRAQFGCEKNEPVLHFFEEDKSRISLGLDDDGNASLHLSGEKGTLSCFVIVDGTPSIEAYDTEGNVTWRAPIYGKGGK